MNIDERIKNLKLMDSIARKTDDEELFYDYWLALGVPDCATEDDYEDIAKDDEMYNDIVNVFKNVVKYTKSFFDLTNEELEFELEFESGVE
jgi:hypothetical protein